jgi:hypothetical protein
VRKRNPLLQHCGQTAWAMVADAMPEGVSDGEELIME